MIAKRMKSFHWMKSRSFWFALFAMLLPLTLFAQGLPGISLTVGSGKAGDISTTLQILMIITLLTLAPSLIISMTSFTRFLIVFSLLRHAMGTNQVPPNQTMVGLALFMTFIVMSPTIKEIHEKAYTPLTQNQITQQEALGIAGDSLKSFMLKYTREKDLALFLSLVEKEKPQTKKELSLIHIIPAFVISELKTSFQIGFMIYLPFLVIDIVVSSVLLAMGMLVLPPVIISLPFKLMLFILVDGWNLIVGSLVKSFEVTT